MNGVTGNGSKYSFQVCLGIFVSPNYTEASLSFVHRFAVNRAELSRCQLGKLSVMKSQELSLEFLELLVGTDGRTISYLTKGPQTDAEGSAQELIDN